MVELFKEGVWYYKRMFSGGKVIAAEQNVAQIFINVEMIVNERNPLFYLEVMYYEGDVIKIAEMRHRKKGE